MVTILSTWVPIIQGIVTILALALGTYIAWKGLSTWRDQISAKGESELAKRVLLCVYRLKDAVQMARFELGTSEDARVDASVLRPLQDKFIGDAVEVKGQLQAELPEARIVWDSLTVVKIEAVGMAVDELWTAYNGYYIVHSDASDKEDDRKILFCNEVGGQDDFDRNLVDRVRRVEDALREKVTFRRSKRQRARNWNWMVWKNLRRSK